MNKKEKCSICGGNRTETIDEVYAIIYYDDSSIQPGWIISASDGGLYNWVGMISTPDTTKKQIEEYIKSFNIRYEFRT